MTGADICGYPAGYAGTYYSLNGLESEDGCTNPADPMSFSSPCPAVAGFANGDQARHVITALGFTPSATNCTGDCDGDCATNSLDPTGGFGASLTCFDNVARWERDTAGFVRCVAVEPLPICEATLDAANSNLTQCSTDFSQCSIDLSGAETQLADADGDGVADPSDACTGSASVQVDSRGCDLTQFCATFDATQKPGKRDCKRADWMNDEPSQKKKERDCTIQKNSRGAADDVCVPNV